MINLRSSIISESTSSPIELSAGQLNMTLQGLVGEAGQGMGVMGLTYTKPELAFGILEYQTDHSAPTRLSIRLDK